jgi:type I restriction enzyme, R subunit
MNTPSFKEDHISQIPALQMLQKLWYIYLSPLEALSLRWDRTTGVILDDILRKQLKEINSIQTSSSKVNPFSDSNIETGILALKSVPFNEGYISATEYIYNLLTLGKTLEQSIDGDKKSFNLKYIDWEHPEKNVFHITEEFSVMKSGATDHYRPDIVLFVNGIPLSIIECKRPDIKDSLRQAIAQHIRNQQEDGIRQLYIYSQLNTSIATDSAMYGTAGTPEQFWGHWTEKFASAEEEMNHKSHLTALKNEPLTPQQKDRLFGDRFKYVRAYFEALESKTIIPAVQDGYLMNVYTPKRFLDLIFGFIVYDNNVKKVARYQQYFAIKKTIERISSIDWGKRNGGVIWHTQWSGKSLTMVMLAQAIANVKTIRNPKIIIVTDRTDLDKQISDTFKKCWRVTNRASTGKNLVENLDSKSDAIITTVINKFVAAVKKIKQPLISADIFVLIDEWHRTQYGDFGIQMQRTLPNACFIAMTGTPLLKKERSTAKKFGWIIDSYTVDQAVKDKAVVPLLYEWRHAVQEVNAAAIDLYFTRISESLTDKQKADLKKKFSRADQLNSADQKIQSIAWDISLHFRASWQETGFKWQLVCQNKESAIKYKKYLDEIGIVTSDVVISAPDDREGEEEVFEKSEDLIKRFWDAKMNEYGSPKKYEETIISRFKNQRDPEIIIVVDKLLTGFDEPKNVVLYITRNLKSHTLLQAIARVNRVAENKEFGYIIDYYGVLWELDTAIEQYSSLEWFASEDLENTFTNITAEMQKLPQKHSELWDIFKSIHNKRDLEAFEQLLRDEEKRDEFYEKLREYGKTLKIALSCVEFHNTTDANLVDTYKNELLMFYKLRQSVAARYSDEIDYRKYESQIQNLIDKHITSGEVSTIVESVNIFEKEKFQNELNKVMWEAAKADTIASRTSKYILEKIEEDPAFYKKFSEMLKEAIKEYEFHRISESEYLTRVERIMNSVLSHTDESFPLEISGNDITKAIYGIIREHIAIKGFSADDAIKAAIFVSLQADTILRNSKIVDWQNNRWN